MDACEPRVRHRGFFLHSPDSGEPDTGEHENPEGFVVRLGQSKNPIPRQMASAPRAVSGSRSSGGRLLRTESRANDGHPAIRSGSVTGSRQRAHLPR
jgi:hypothetical protein